MRDFTICCHFCHVVVTAETPINKGLVTEVTKVTAKFKISRVRASMNG